MTTQPVEKRKPLTRKQVIQLMLDQAGVCGCGCGEKLNPMTEGVIDEHVRALGLLGSNDLANRSLWRKPCSAKKTSEADIPRIAKAERQGGGRGSQTARRAAGKTKAIPNRGFEGHRNFKGEVVRKQVNARRAPSSSPEDQ